MTNAREFNFDGLVGPSHNYAGLSFGNVASFENLNQTGNPKDAALQGLAKMYALSARGFAQAVLPPQLRPNFKLLRRIGFTGSDADVLAKANKQSPFLLASAWSAAPMWSANAATVSPSPDTSDGRLHFTVANLNNKLHRSYEHEQTLRTLRRLFDNEQYFAVHEPLPSSPAFSDEGAANHTRLCVAHGEAGIEIFTYGRIEFNLDANVPKRFPARQTLEASQAIARLHGLQDDRTIYLHQNPDVIDQGVFHNDVIAVGNANVLFYHQDAFLDEKLSLESVANAMAQIGAPFHPIRVDRADVAVKDAVSSYLFNSQLLSKDNGKMTLVVPQECQNNPHVSAYLKQLIGSSGPIDELLIFDLRQSMCNGGGPACLRLRVVLNDEQVAHMHRDVIMTESLYARLVQWVEKHYRDQLSPADLVDPTLAIECQIALEELSQILNLPGLYDF